MNACFVHLHVSRTRSDKYSISGCAAVLLMPCRQVFGSELRYVGMCEVCARKDIMSLDQQGLIVCHAADPFQGLNCDDTHQCLGL